MKKASIFLLTLTALLWAGYAQACTSFIVSGRVTPDGRPLAFKNRDTHDLNNHAVLIKGERYRFLAVTGDRSKDVTSIWQGHNEAGFAIFDTAAYNLNSGDSTNLDKQPKDWFKNHGEGWIMKRALEICATTKDFENFLDTLSRPLGCDGNLGVIDAKGGAAYYEVSNKGYVKFDVNDPKIAPYGYLIRTNHGFSGDRSLDQGVERYLAIDRIMLDAGFTGNLNADYLFGKVVRNLKHGLTGIDLYDLEPESANQTKLFPFRDFIPRYLTASATLIQGVAKGEDPLHTVSYTIIGNTLTTVAIPLVITPEGKLPQVVTADADNHSPLCQAGLKVKKIIFPYTRGNGSDYIDIAKLINKNGDGVLQKVLSIEKVIKDKGKPVIDNFRSDKPDYKQVYNYYQWVDNYINDEYKSEFGVTVL